MLIAVAKWGIIINTLFYVNLRVSATVVFLETTAPSSIKFDELRVKISF